MLDLIGFTVGRVFSCLALLNAGLPSDLRSLGLLILNLALFLLPGFALAAWLGVRRPAALRYPLITIVIASAFLGYASFFLFLFSKSAGRLFVAAIYFASLILLGAALRSCRVVTSVLGQVAEPLALVAITAVCYFSFTFLFINPMATGAGYVNGRFFRAELPGDNRIPFFFAERLYDRKPLRPFCCGGWLSSDRPPLQTGIFLMERPLSLTSNVELDYQMLATGLQCLWICGVWSFLQSLGMPILQIRRTLCVLIFSGVIFFNSIYVWPKFLTATLVFFAVSVLIDLVRNRRAATSLDTGIASTSLGLALVSHPGSLFSLVAVALFLFRFRALFSIRHAALAMSILLAFVLPWTAFQKFVDPPGTRLIKLHLAGDDEIGSRTPMEAIRRAYETHSFREITSLRWSNVMTLTGYTPFDTLGLHDAPARLVGALEWNRSLQEQYLWNALGPLNVGWLAALFWLVKRRPGSRSIPHAAWMLLAVAANICVWCLVEFGPRFGIVAHLSFADLLLLSIALVTFIDELPKILILAVLAVQLFNFFVVWIWSPPTFLSSWAGSLYAVDLQPTLLLFGVFSTLALLAHLGRSFLPLGRQAGVAVP